MGKGPAINFVFYDSVSRLGMADRMDLYLVVPVLRLWLSAILEISNDNFYGIDCQMNLCLILGTYCHQWVNCVAYQFALVFVMSLLSCDELTWSSYRANLIPFIQSVFFVLLVRLQNMATVYRFFRWFWEDEDQLDGYAMILSVIRDCPHCEMCVMLQNQDSRSWCPVCTSCLGSFWHEDRPHW